MFWRCPRWRRRKWRQRQGRPPRKEHIFLRSFCIYIHYDSARQYISFGWIGNRAVHRRFRSVNPGRAVTQPNRLTITRPTERILLQKELENAYAAPANFDWRANNVFNS